MNMTRKMSIHTKSKGRDIWNLLRFSSLYLAAMTLLAVSACQPVNNNDLSAYTTNELWNYAFNTTTWDVMKNKYYWYDGLPATLSITSEDPNSFLSALLQGEDKAKNFSGFRSTYSYLTGIYGVASAVHGFGLIEYDGKVYIGNVYQGSEAAKEGIRRGYRFVSIGGANSSAPASAAEASAQLQKGSTNSIMFEKPDGSQVQYSIGKSEITLPFVLPIVDANGNSEICTVIRHANKKVGYMHYLSFLSNTDEELINAIKYFNAYDGGAGIDELILDLRYNGGGYITHLRTLVSAILTADYQDEGVFYFKYNPQYRPQTEIANTLSSDELSEKGIKNLGLGRVFVLTTESSASASEALISALSPIIDIEHIGQKTYGKPVGQEVYWNHESYGYVFFLVTFALFNRDAYDANNFDNSLLYFDGIAPDYEVSEFKEETIMKDGVPHTLYVLKEFGSAEDPLVNAALHFIEHGTYPNAQAGANENTVSTMDKQDVFYHTEYPTSISLFLSPDDLIMLD